MSVYISQLFLEYETLGAAIHSRYSHVSENVIITLIILKFNLISTILHFLENFTDTFVSMATIRNTKNWLTKFCVFGFVCINQFSNFYLTPSFEKSNVCNTQGVFIF